MGNLIRGVRFFYLLWGGMLVGTLTINNRIRLPDPVWHWPWLAQLFYTGWGRGLLLGIAAAMSLAALVEVWELVDLILARFFHDKDH